MGLLDRVVREEVHRDYVNLVGSQGWCGQAEVVTLLLLLGLRLTSWTGVHGRPHSRSTLDAGCCFSLLRLCAS